MNHFVGQQTLFSQKYTQTKLAAINGMTVGIQFSLAHADIQSRSVNEAPPRSVEEMKLISGRKVLRLTASKRQPHNCTSQVEED